MLVRIDASEALERLDAYDAIVDARSESEFAEDRLPGAVNWPSLSDAERASVGSEYKQISAFDAKKRGAALVARNVAAHIEREVLDKRKEWQPLVYCWRGGQRSGALAAVLDQIGFRVSVLDGGYREYRRAVLAALERLPHRLSFRVVCGTTGSGKSRLLEALAGQGAQVLDLEALACHRGSVLGLVPGEVQPTQKQFETRVWNALRRFDAERPVFVESESKKVGDLRVPAVLIERMRTSTCVWLELAIERRIELLMDEYAFFVDDVEAFCRRLDALRTLRGHRVVEAWQEQARSGDLRTVVRALLEQHYDPIYLESMQRNFSGLATAPMRIEWDGSAASLERAARRLLGDEPSLRA